MRIFSALDCQIVRYTYPCSRRIYNRPRDANKADTEHTFNNLTPLIRQQNLKTAGLIWEILTFLFFMVKKYA